MMPLQRTAPQHHPSAHHDDEDRGWLLLRSIILRNGRPPPPHHRWPPTAVRLLPLPALLQAEAVEVTWRPPQRHLHYDALYRGIFEFLRAPPNNRYREAALRYLSVLRDNTTPQLRPDIAEMQAHRVQWTLAWFQALPDDSDECSDAETVASETEG